MATQFVKIYGERLLNSTLWLECWQAKLVFIGMLASADHEGFVDFPSVAALAHRLNLPVQDVITGLSVLEAPDPDSRSKEAEGRRVFRVDCGWKLVNYTRYRESRTMRQIDGAKRVAKHRAKAISDASVTCNDVTPDLDLDKEEREREATAHAQPPAVDRLPEFSARQMRTTFVREYEAVQRSTPGMGGKHVDGLHAAVLRTAELQGVAPETLFVNAVRAWLGGTLSDRERQSPYACFTQAWGSLSAKANAPKREPLCQRISLI